MGFVSFMLANEFGAVPPPDQTILSTLVKKGEYWSNELVQMRYSASLVSGRKRVAVQSRQTVFMTGTSYQHGRQTLSAQAAVGGKLQGRYGAAKSLDIVRLNIQAHVNKEIDHLLKKYIDPAVANIKKNLGEDSVTENSLRFVCIQMLEDAKTQYFTDNKKSGQNIINRQFNRSVDFEPDSHQIASQSHLNTCKRKEQDEEKTRKKVLRTVTSIIPGTPTPIKLVKLEGIRREGPKWDPNRITQSTLFIMGARANKVLGFGQTRGRLYTKHPELLKYSGDTEDKEWLSRNNLMPPTGGIAYLLVLDDVKEIAESADYRHNPNVLLHELKGFLAPHFMLVKIKTFIAQARTEGPEITSYPEQNLYQQTANNGFMDTNNFLQIAPISYGNDNSQNSGLSALYAMSGQQIGHY